MLFLVEGERTTSCIVTISDVRSMWNRVGNRSETPISRLRANKEEVPDLGTPEKTRRYRLLSFHYHVRLALHDKIGSMS